jgi:hypothetical protein
MNKAYLGDSVYVEVENMMLKLTTNNGYSDDPRNVIYLDADTFEALLKYVKQIPKQPII